MKILSNKILVEELEREERTEGGLYIAQTTEEFVKRGKVIDVGPGFLSEHGILPMVVKKDDIIRYNPTGRIEIKLNGRKYYLLGEESALLVE